VRISALTKYEQFDVRHPSRLTCEWLQTEHLEINDGASSVVRFDLVTMGQVTHLTVNHLGLVPDSSLLKIITPGWPMILSSLKSPVDIEV
jgi:hypothetical protein